MEKTARILLFLGFAIWAGIFFVAGILYGQYRLSSQIKLPEQKIPPVVVDNYRKEKIKEHLADLINSTEKAPATLTCAGVLALELGFLPEAEKYFQQAETPDNPVLIDNQIHYAHLLYFKGDHKKALFYLQKAYQTLKKTYLATEREENFNMFFAMIINVIKKDHLSSSRTKIKPD